MAATADEAVINSDGIIRPSSADPALQEAFLPTKGRENHASFLLALSNGDLACVWFAGTEEGQPDVSIFFSSLAAGADRWSEEVQISDDTSRSEQNPVLFETPNGELWVIYTAQKIDGQDTSIVRRRISTDFGKSWGPIETLFDEPGLFIRQPIVAMDNGEWLLPVFHCRPIQGESWHGHNDVSAVKISSDRGRSWTEYPVPDSLGAVHMDVLEVGSGKLIGLFRSRYADAIKRSESTDYGRTWTEPRPIAVPNNNSSIQARRLADGTIALVYNHTSASFAPGKDTSIEPAAIEPPAPDGKGIRRAVWGIQRAPLSIALSTDEGQTFPVHRVIEAGDRKLLNNDSPKLERRKRELSYPSVMQTADGAINVTYTYFREAIKHVRFAKDWISGERA
ncbi:sialidase family protein [Consotaella aegiceratis]|uniref:sialidase family protein n=1 Tax=Consotaella aegiceratis TaxID=3097961 RepID=UPI002F424018